MKIKEKSTEEKVIRKYLLRLRQPRIKKKENRYYIRGYKGTEVIIRTDHEILKRIAYRRTCVKQSAFLEDTKQKQNISIQEKKTEEAAQS